MQLPITVGLHRSRFLSLGLVLAHLAVVAIVLAAPWVMGVKALLLSCLLVSGTLGWRWMAPRVECLRLLADGGMEGRLLGGANYESFALFGSATVHQWLTVFRVAGEAGRFAVVIAPDSINAEDFRRLRVWLRWRADFSGASGAA